MTHTYQLTGMTCGNCEAKVKNKLLSVPGVTSAEVSKDTKSATLSMSEHVPLTALQHAIAGVGHQYEISPMSHNETIEKVQSWFETYKPILLIFAYILLITILVQVANQRFDWMQWMRHFMAGFFLTFSFFKLLNLKGFAESYSMYDVVAKRIPQWGYIYAFLELGLGIAYLINVNPLITLVTTFIVMSISIIGVLQSVLNKRKIQCACLGDVFKLPMSTVTIIEDALMITMSAYMVFYLINL